MLDRALAVLRARRASHELAVCSTPPFSDPSPLIVDQMQVRVIPIVVEDISRCAVEDEAELR